MVSLIPSAARPSADLCTNGVNGHDRSRGIRWSSDVLGRSVSGHRAGTDRQGAGGILVAWRSSGLAARDRPGREGPRRTAGPLRQGLQREGREGPRRAVHARGRDRGRGRRGHAGPRRHRRAVLGDLQGERRRHARRGRPTPCGSSGTDLAIEEGTASLTDRARSTSRRPTGTA